MNLDDYLESNGSLDLEEEKPNLDDPSTTDKDPIEEQPNEALQTYFNYLKEVEVLDLPEDFEFKATEDSLKEAISISKQNSVKNTTQQLWNSLPDDFKPLLEYALKGGTDLNAFLEAQKTLDVENLDISDDITKRLVIKSYFKLVNPKLDEAQIEKRIDRLAEIADLGEEAADAIEYLKTHKDEKMKSLLDQTTAQKQAQLAAYKQEMDDIVKTIDSSTDLDSNRKNRLKTFLITPTSNSSTGFESALDSVYANPAHKVQLANILADYDPKLGFNFDRLQKKLKSEATTAIKELMAQNLNPKAQTKGNTKPVAEDFDWTLWAQKE